MKRIGVTTEGAALIEVSPEECAVLLRAASLLQGMDFMIRTVRAASPAEQKLKDPKWRAPIPAPPPAAAGAPKLCKHCNKPVDVAKGRQCRACMNRIYGQEKAPKKTPPPSPGGPDKRFAPKTHVLSGRVTRASTAAPREHDPDLDRPRDEAGRTERVGAQD